MTPEQKRIAIAEFCGWFPEIESSYPNRLVWSNGERVGYTDQDLPNYINDLNAMHEAEKLGSAANADAYQEHLENETRKTKTAVWHATAAQRADALLKVMGKI